MKSALWVWDIGAPYWPLTIAEWSRLYLRPPAYEPIPNLLFDSLTKHPLDQPRVKIGSQLRIILPHHA